MTFYCPQCWREVPADATECPSCGYDISAHEALSYEEKLIAALAHPIRENRLFAIQALGDPAYRGALPHLAKVLREAQDYYVLRETLVALSRIDSPESRALIVQATEHPSKLGRNFANQLVAKERVV